MTKQVKFYDIENETAHAGILTDEGNVICGCCGSVFEAEDHGETWRLIHVYNAWINLDNEIVGKPLGNEDTPPDETCRAEYLRELFGKELELPLT